VRLIAALVVVVLLIFGALLLVTNTPWGRERVRRYVEGLVTEQQSRTRPHRGVTGNLLRGFTLHDVVITDSAHRPFIKADEAWARYSLTTLRGKRIDFRDVKLVRPVVVIEKLPGDNGLRSHISRDTTTPAGPRKTGWGTWDPLQQRERDAGRSDGALALGAGSAQERREQKDAVRRALGPEERLKVFSVANGYEKEFAFHNIDGFFRWCVSVDPAYKTRVIDVAALKMIAAPFVRRRRCARTHGRFEFTGDSLWFKNARVAFPQTKATGNGK